MAVLVSTYTAGGSNLGLPAVLHHFHRVGTSNAGCSIADELFVSFEQLLTLADRRGIKYDRYVTA